MTMAASYRNFHHHPPHNAHRTRAGHTLQAAELSCAAMVSCGGCKRRRSLKLETPRGDA